MGRQQDEGEEIKIWGGDEKEGTRDDEIIHFGASIFSTNLAYLA